MAKSSPTKKAMRMKIITIIIRKKYILPSIFKLKSNISYEKQRIYLYLFFYPAITFSHAQY